eukprot:scaffold945_cov170-Amphora_coffeaeformis.AAC.19
MAVLLLVQSCDMDNHHGTPTQRATKSPGERGPCRATTKGVPQNLHPSPTSTRPTTAHTEDTSHNNRPHHRLPQIAGNRDPHTI